MLSEVAAMAAAGFGFYVSGRLLWRGLALMVGSASANQDDGKRS